MMDSVVWHAGKSISWQLIMVSLIIKIAPFELKMKKLVDFLSKIWLLVG